MSVTRRARRESARQQAQLRLRRLQARSRRPRRRWLPTGLRGLLWQRKTLALVAALALAAIIAFPVFAPGAPPATPTPAAEPSPTSGPVAKTYPQAPQNSIATGTEYSATVQTAKGTFSFELLPDAAPAAANNLVFLAQDQYYNNASTVTRVAPNQQVQMGARTGQPGPGYAVTLSGSPPPARLGSVVAVDQGGGMGSEFAVLLEDPPEGQGGHVIGRVTAGLDVVRQLQEGDQIQSVRIQELERSSSPQANPAATQTP